MNLTPLAELATRIGCKVTENAPLSAATTFKVGGPADLLIDLPDDAAAGQVLACCARENIPWLFIGNGSNLLVGDKGFRGAVLRLDGHGATPVCQEELGAGWVYAPAGMSLQRLCLFARDNCLTGLEFAYGIPGTVGGAVYMNAGAYDGCMGDVVLFAHCRTAEGEPCILPAAELAMTYRHTALMDKSLIVTGVTIQLQPGDRETIAARMKELMTRRQDKQPLEYPSAGSFFKRPTGYFAGALIEQAGLKGYTVGGAQVSEKHAGFVINRGGATAADILALCRDVQDAIWAKNAVRLEPEVRFVGEF
ncbi:MAG: UDP-N-acetylmuramate dehydrogenase [Clostridia bacterium]|nr:UDP-N-acetylmuramate dehydrogenase [Clostridia bacterium]